MIQGKRFYPMPRRKSNLLLYLLLNILVSAATTLGVLMAWDHLRPPPLTRPPEVDPDEIALPVTITETVPTPTLPPLDAPVMQIIGVVGPGDLESEYVILRRVGAGNLVLTGWTLSGGQGGSFTFPAQPELTLYKDGALEVHTRAGDNTALEVYMNRAQADWRSGETIQLLDREGNPRAEYKIP